MRDHITTAGTVARGKRVPDAQETPTSGMVRQARDLVDKVYGYIRAHRDNLKIIVAPYVIGRADNRSIRLDLGVAAADPAFKGVYVTFTDYIDPQAHADFRRLRHSGKHTDTIFVYALPEPLTVDAILAFKSTRGHNTKGSLFHEIIHLLQARDPDSTLSQYFKSRIRNTETRLRSVNYWDQDWEIEAHTLTAVYELLEELGSVEQVLARYSNENKLLEEIGRRLTKYAVVRKKFDTASQSKTNVRVRNLVRAFYRDLKRIQAADASVTVKQTPAQRASDEEWLRYRFKGARAVKLAFRGKEYRLEPDTKFSLCQAGSLPRLKPRIKLDDVPGVVFKVEPALVDRIVAKSAKLRLKAK